MSTRSTRAKAAQKRGASTFSPSKSSSSKSKSKYFGKKGKADVTDMEDHDAAPCETEAGDENEEYSEISDLESLDSDALDDEDDYEDTKASGTGKRQRNSAPRKTLSKRTPKKTVTPQKFKGNTRKKRKTAKDEDKDEDEDDEGSDFDLNEGQEIVGVVVQAPKTGRVPPGRISQNTLDFLNQLKKPECNDREWFKLHEPVYRLAENEWKAFVEEFTDVLIEVDPQIPHLPPKDVIHRIYRDIRFSNDKTPYKTGLSATFSRSGRKGIFAAYHIAVRAGGQSMIAAGAWCPGKNEIATIRANLKRSSRRLRQVISNPDFEALFGPARPHPKGERQNIFGGEDELKVAPKGVDKTHKDIDLLKCRSFAVIHKFTDKEVLQPGWKDELANVARVIRPFVHCINDLMTIQGGDSSSEESEGEGDDE